MPDLGKTDCDVVFDFCSPHNGEYWYRCNTCGRTDWCAAYDKFKYNEPLKDCPNKKVKVMFDPEQLKVGDVFYSVKEHNQAFARIKIHQEFDGEDWFRYDRPLRTYEIVTYTVLGILRKELEGEWKHDPDGYDLQTGFFVSLESETHLGWHEMNFYRDPEKYFIDKDEALVYKQELEQEARELDKK